MQVFIFVVTIHTISNGNNNNIVGNNTIAALSYRQQAANTTEGLGKYNKKTENTIVPLQIEIKHFRHTITHIHTHSDWDQQLVCVAKGNWLTSVKAFKKQTPTSQWTPQALIHIQTATSL